MRRTGSAWPHGNYHPAAPVLHTTSGEAAAGPTGSANRTQLKKRSFCMRKLALSAAAAATLIVGAATAAFALPAGSTLPAGAGAQPAAEQVQYDGRGDCYWRD